MKPTQYDPATLRAIADDVVLMEVGRKAVEDELIDMRDRRMWIGLRNNGLTIKEQDGRGSNVIRFGPEVGVQIALRAIAGASPSQLAALRRKFGQLAGDAAVTAASAAATGTLDTVVDAAVSTAVDNDEDAPRFSNGDRAPVDLMHGEAADAVPDDISDEQIYENLKTYQDAGMIGYVLPSEPLGEVWVIGWNGEILKFLTKEGITGFLTGIGVCARFVTSRGARR